MSEVQQIAGMYANILEELGAPMRAGAAVLDFGCGNGEVVEELWKRGFRAYGVDIEPAYVETHARMEKSGLVPPGETIFSLLDLNDYRFAVPDASMDFVVSNQVFEHAKNFGECIGEIHRVLKPGGASLHIFPSRYRPLETHVHVPLGGVLQNRPWLAFWAATGWRAPFQKEHSRREVYEFNSSYLPSGTHYLSKAEMEREITPWFKEFRWEEGPMIKHGYGRIRYTWPLFSRFSFLLPLIGTLHTRVLFLRKEG